ncbi:hypothetical protein Ami103574_00330 [Aminipila butyrica]|uniref:Uncharacterized protein n=1 Tax=Aminipila butyrica TaxID=433296 RepID=A0A858BRN1_9FIRM|nr:hypothetical protein [Aminipila butyrica]QIB67849.1 hypothetical protein Ami103574_00330 [Aminipila butyrica]
MYGKYAIVLKSPMGPKKGFLYLDQQSSTVEGILECLGKRHLFSGTLSQDGKLLAQGILKAPLGEEPFMLLGNIQEKILTARLQRKNQEYELMGTEVDENRLK